MEFMLVLACLLLSIEERMELLQAKSELHQFFYIIARIFSGMPLNTNKIYLEIVNANALTKCIWLIIT